MCLGKIWRVALEAHSCPFGGGVICTLEGIPERAGSADLVPVGNTDLSHTLLPQTFREHLH